MATTTPNYGWPVPTSTDYVKDGATAIEALGDAIDATVFGLGSGLKLITANTFSAQSTISLNNCFSATYSAYRIIANFNTPSVNTGIRWRLRAAGTDASGANYNGMKLQQDTSTISNFGDTGATFISMMDMEAGSNNGANYCVTMDVVTPFVASRTTGTINNIGIGSNFKSYVGGFMQGLTTSYDGFSFFAVSGNFSGTIRVYGYQN
jgi:hypothetical protein